jgi:hypothetical protein
MSKEVDQYIYLITLMSSGIHTVFDLVDRAYQDNETAIQVLVWVRTDADEYGDS